MSRKDVAQEFVDWARGDLLMALHAMAGCIGIARARMDGERAMRGVPHDLQRQLRHDLRMPPTPHRSIPPMSNTETPPKVIWAPAPAPDCHFTARAFEDERPAHRYHHDAVVQELREAADRLVNNPGWGTVNYTDGQMWADGEALRAALAKLDG